MNLNHPRLLPPVATNPFNYHSCRVIRRAGQFVPRRANVFARTTLNPIATSLYRLSKQDGAAGVDRQADNAVKEAAKLITV